MGVFSKLKGIFYDEVVVDEPEDEIEKVDKIVKKEKIEEKPKVEKIKFTPIEEIEEEPVKEVETKKEDNTFSERELFKSERTFNFTEFDDEEELPPRKNVLNFDSRPTSRSTEPSPVIPETQRVFKPSPVISPIYGILDKDYKRDEVKPKAPVKDVVQTNVTTYDTVRRKAYGTLEDELEDTLNSMNKISTKTINEELNNDEDKVEEIENKTAKIEDLINRIEDATDDLDKSMSIGELEDNTHLDNFEDEEEITDKTMTDSTLEHDLFNLIDSMYDDKEE